jgi:lincosamide nucleotidyltransferase A/C/D/E
MELSEALTVLDAIGSTGCRYWLEGGWGVDALVGHLTRPHRDVDVDLDHACTSDVIAALEKLGYEVETDWRPNRVELVSRTGRGWVDLHPLVIEENGDARQAAVDGGWHELPATWFTTGSLDGVSVPCVSVDAQRTFHAGYELRDVDRLDLAQLDRLPR